MRGAVTRFPAAVSVYFSVPTIAFSHPFLLITTIWYFLTFKTKTKMTLPLRASRAGCAPGKPPLSLSRHVQLPGFAPCILAGAASLLAAGLGLCREILGCMNALKNVPAGKPRLVQEHLAPSAWDSRARGRKLPKGTAAVASAPATRKTPNQANRIFIFYELY